MILNRSVYAFGIGSSPECRVTDFGALDSLVHLQCFSPFRPRGVIENGGDYFVCC